MSATEPSSLAFHDVVIDLAGRRLLRAGVPQSLEPKAFAVLALLAGAPGRAFSRDDILDSVWGHRHVTPGVLNRVMTLLRHALGEDAQTPRYLHTLHGVGYRFDLPAAATLQPVAEDPVAMPSVVASADSVIEPDVAVTPAEVIAPRRRQADIASTPTIPVPAPRPRIARVITAILVLVACGFGVWWWRETHTDGVRSAFTTTPTQSVKTMVVMPLQAIGNAPADNELAAGLSEELIGTLSHINGLRVIARDSASIAAVQSSDPSQLARRLGVSHVLQGSVRQDNDQLRISMRLLEAASGRLLWSQDFDRQSGDLFVIQDNIAHAVGAALQLQLQVGATPLASAHEDPELYRRYLLAAGQITTGTNSPLAAVSDLRTLVTEHPDYARGWGGLAYILWGLSAAPKPERNALRSESEHAAAKALALDPRQPDALAVLGGQACNEQRWEDCLRLVRAAVRESPSSIHCRVLLARGLATMGYVDAALHELDTVQILDPLSPFPNLFRGRVLDTLGRHDEARDVLRLVNPPESATAMFYNAAWRGDAAEMRRIALTLPMETPWRRSELAAADAVADPSRWPLAEALAPAEEQQLASLGGVAYDFNRMLYPNRDYARDIDSFDQVQRQGYATYQWIFWQPESRGLRQSPAFQAYLKRSGLLAYWQKHGFPPQCRADADGAHCH